MSFSAVTSGAGTSRSKFLPARVVVREIELDDRERRAKLLAAELGVPLVVANILLTRGIHDVETAKTFLSPSLKESLPDPAAIKNIDAAAELLLNAISEKKLITIYCDFDVDGLTAGSQLYLFLSAIGARVNVYTPNRFTEGYGLISAAVEKLAHSGTQLLMTVDCGISSIREIGLAKRLGMQTIVLDHHIPHELPPADVVVDPAQDGCPFQEYKLAAAGLALMLIIHLRRKVRDRFADKIAAGEMKLPDPKEFLDLAALGTICDMVPLEKVNRIIAHRGIEALKHTTRPGLVALKRVAGLRDERLSAGNVGFSLGPRINAAGRLAEAKEIIELLTTTSESQAQSIASRLDSLNMKRKNIEDGVLATSHKLLRGRGDIQPAAITVFDESFHIGVIGIVAQRLVEHFYRPAVVMAPGESTVNGVTKPVIKGSVRSIRGFHVAQALETLGDILLTHGGHAEAGGFSLAPENLELFHQRFVAHAESQLSDDLLERRVYADSVVRLCDIDFDVVSALARLGPFGIGNPTPVLVAENITIESVSSLSGDHLKFRVREADHCGNAIAWRFRGHPLIKRGEQVHMAFCPEINVYNGVSSVQLTVKEVWR